MSLNRTALRLAAVVALTNNAGAPYPTIAEGRVFDSRMDPAQIVDGQELQPYITIYTDDDSGDALSSNNGGPPWGRAVNLVLQLTVGAHGELRNPETGEVIPAFGLIDTDFETEAMLDLLEFQADRALFGLSSWATVFQNTIIRAVSRRSVRFAEPGDAAVKYAERMVTYAINMKDDWVSGEDHLAVAVDALPASPPAALPRHIAELVAAASSGGGSAYITQTVETLTTFGLPAPMAAAKLKRLRIIEDERDAQDRRTNPRSQGNDSGIAQATFDD